MTDVMEGVRILEVAEQTFVPAASALLADWGAEVIKIEHVERGDAMRGLASSGIAMISGSVHVLLEHSNRGKQSLGLDLTSPEGLDILYKLAATCDVFLTNKLAGVRKKLKIDVEDVRAHNPNIIYARGTGQGERGPDADKGAYDSLAFWARAGVSLAVTRTDYDHVVGPPGPGLRRLDRRHDHRGRHHGRAVPSRADGRGDHRRRVAAGLGHVGHGPDHQPVAAARTRRGSHRRVVRRVTHSPGTTGPRTGAGSR